MLFFCEGSAQKAAMFPISRRRAGARGDSRQGLFRTRARRSNPAASGEFITPPATGEAWFRLETATAIGVINPQGIRSGCSSLP
jgi:hypothetical protein